MITFETWEDFESAVMVALSNRLRVKVQYGGEYESYNTRVTLQDQSSKYTRTEIDSDCD